MGRRARGDRPHHPAVRRRDARRRIAFAIGTLATIAANVAGAHPTLAGRAVAAWPALALLLVVEMLSRKGRQIAGELSIDAPVSPGMAPLVTDTAEALAYRDAAAELRRTSKLGALNAG